MQKVVSKKKKLRKLRFQKTLIVARLRVWAFNGYTEKLREQFCLFLIEFENFFLLLFTPVPTEYFFGWDKTTSVESANRLIMWNKQKSKAAPK